MQKLKVLLLTALAVYTLTMPVFGRDIFAIRSVLGSPETPANCTISVAAGEVLEFSAADLERRLGLYSGELGGITLTSVPGGNQGALVLDGVEVANYDFLSRQEVDRLCYVPGEAASGVKVSFLPQSRDAVTTSLSIQILSGDNQPPVIEDLVLETVQNVAITGQVSASDPEGGNLRLQLITKPQKGSVHIDGLGIRYQPYKDATGSDSFVLCAVDNASAYSREAVVHVQIAKSASARSYLDMNSNPSAYAAIMLWEQGVLTGDKIGSGHLFHPDRRMERGDFLLALLASAGLENTVQPSVNTGLPNDGEIPTWLKPYVSAAIRADILPGNEAFHWSEIPTRAEAVVLTDRAAGINDVKDYDLTMPDRQEIPSWALPSYRDLAAYRMLDLHDGRARPDGALTNSYAADLCWQLYKHKHR